MSSLHAGAFEAVLEAAGYDSPSYRRALEALIGFLDLPDHDTRTVVLNRFRAEGYRLLDTSPYERLMLDGEDTCSRALRALFREARGEAALCIGRRYPLEQVFAAVLFAAHGIREGTEEYDLILEVLERPLSQVVLEALLSNLEVLAIHDRPLGPFRAFFTSDRLPVQHRSFLALAAPTAIEADLTISQEEVYYTLLLDGMEFHEAAEVALAV